MRSILYWLLITFGLMGVLAMSACNTVNGFGKDLQNAGKAIEGSSTSGNNQQPEETGSSAPPVDSPDRYPNSRAY